MLKLLTIGYSLPAKYLLFQAGKLHNDFRDLKILVSHRKILLDMI